jgi:hypothetical protein
MCSRARAKPVAIDRQMMLAARIGSQLVADFPQQTVSPFDAFFVLDSQWAKAVDDTQDASPLLRFREHDFSRIGRCTIDVTNLRDHLDGVQHVDGIETITQEDDEAMTCAERECIFARQFLEGVIGTGPADQALARCLAEGEPKSDSRYCGHQCFMDVLDRFDEMSLAENEIRRVGFVDLHGDELHVEHLRRARRHHHIE